MVASSFVYTRSQISPSIKELFECAGIATVSVLSVARVITHTVCIVE